jgi:predicted regulator of Ras-like GTPase activity (Roadblock/LC7/MglB family)
MSQNIAQDILFHRVQQELRGLKGVKTSLIASRDGYILTNPAESQLEKYAKASSSMLKTADAAILEMSNNCSESVIVDFPNERLIATRAGPKALIAVLAGSDINVNTILTELSKAANKVREIM